MKLKPNGTPTTLDLVWTPVMKGIVSVLFFLLGTGIVATITLHTKVAVIEQQLAEVHEDISGHINSSGRGTMHEGAEIKLERIREEIERYHSGRP